MPTQQVYIDTFTSEERSNCMRSYYTTELNWYEYTTEMLSPVSCIYKDSNGDSYIEYSTSDSSRETSLLILVTTIGILLLLLIINYRSSGSARMDWFRLILLYIFGTLTVVLVVKLSPKTPGFYRLLGFGILIHNFAEAYLLKHIWFGSQGVTSFISVSIAIIYLWIMSTFIWSLPIDVFFFVALWQGATLDYFLAFTLPLVASKFHHKRPWNRCSWILASCASAIHILSIQPLFFGVSLAYSSLSAFTTIFLFPTFFLYTFFAIRELGRVSFIGPTYESSLKKDLINDNDIMVELQEANNNDTDTKKDEKVEKAEKKDIVVRNILKEIKSYKSLHGVALLSRIADTDIEVALDLACRGIMRYFNISKKTFLSLFICGTIAAFINAVAIFWAPCYIHLGCHR